MFSHNELHALILTHCLQMYCECLQAVLFVQIKCNSSLMPERGYFLRSGATHYHFNSISSPTETCLIFILRGLIRILCSIHTENARDLGRRRSVCRRHGLRAFFYFLIFEAKRFRRSENYAKCITFTVSLLSRLFFLA